MQPVVASLCLQDNQPQQASSPALASALSVLAAAFLQTASLSLRRAYTVVERLPAVAVAGSAAAPGAAGAAEESSDAAQVAAQQAQAQLRWQLEAAGSAAAAARQRATAVGSKLAFDEEVGEVPSLAAAQVGVP